MYSLYIFFVIFKFLVMTIFCILKEKQSICKKFLMSQGPGGNGAQGWWKVPQFWGLSCWMTREPGVLTTPSEPLELRVCVWTAGSKCENRAYTAYYLLYPSQAPPAAYLPPYRKSILLSFSTEHTPHTFKPSFVLWSNSKQQSKSIPT